MITKLINTTLIAVENVFILDNEGNRLLSKSYTISPTEVSPSTKEQKAFEKNVFEKTKKFPSNEVFFFQNKTILYKSIGDLFFYFVCVDNENEIFVNTALDAYTDVLNNSLKNSLDKKSLLSNYDIAVALLDDIVDRGVIIETDVAVLTERVDSMKKTHTTSIFEIASEQSFSSAFAAAKSQIAKSFLRQ